MSDNTFREFEHQNWLAKADNYRDAFGRMTERANGPILDIFGDLSLKRFLDVACGTGELTAEAAKRGAIAEGLDFASSMIKNAEQRYPYLNFVEGDAENLPYPDSTFDAISCCFGLLHLQDPDRAIREARRVLKSGGHYIFTSWCGPDQGGDFFELILSAIRKYGTLDVPLPVAPPLFRFSDPGECRRTLLDAGFVLPSVSVLELDWIFQSGAEIIDFIYKNIVRTTLILQAQTLSARERIHLAIIEDAEKFRKGEVIRIKFPATLASAQSE